MKILEIPSFAIILIFIKLLFLIFIFTLFMKPDHKIIEIKKQLLNNMTELKKV